MTPHGAAEAAEPEKEPPSTRSQQLCAIHSPAHASLRDAKPSQIFSRGDAEVQSKNEITSPSLRSQRLCAIHSPFRVFRSESCPYPPALPRNSGMVASPAAIIPSRLTTLNKVSKIIFKSNPNDRWSTYHTSSSNFCSHEIALRPLI